jgi:transcriptional regulator with XRE-family HTH domain
MARTRRQYGRKRPVLPNEAPAAAAVRRARRALGMTQAQLGTALSVTATTIARWEGQRAAVSKPKREALIERLAKKDPKLAAELAKALGVIGQASLAGPPEHRRAQLDQVVLRTAEALDIVPSLAKKVTCEVVTRLARVGMGPKEAMALLGLEIEG